MEKRNNLLIQILREDTGLALSISIGIYLFFLFFQPISLDRFDFNTRLTFIAGPAGINFFFIIIIRGIYKFTHYKRENENPFVQPYLGSFLILTLSSVACIFYVRFVGQIKITFPIAFKMIFICLVAPLLLGLIDRLRELQSLNQNHLDEIKNLQKKLEQIESESLNKTIEFVSEYGNENLSLTIADIAFMKSADNYVEIVYKEDGGFKKKLIRNTLKNIELQLKPYSNFIRCHRICIINKNFIEKLTRKFNNQFIIIKGFEEQIPVSRQYILKLKEEL